MECACPVVVCGMWNVRAAGQISWLECAAAAVDSGLGGASAPAPTSTVGMYMARYSYRQISYPIFLRGSVRTITVQNPRGYNLCSMAERWRSKNVKACCWWKCLTVTVRILSAHTCLQCRKDRSLTPCRLNKALGCISLVPNSATHLSNRFMLRYAMLSGRARLDTGGKSFPGSKPILFFSNARTVGSPVAKRRASLFYP